MPDDVKKHILNHSANVAALDDDNGLFTFAVDRRLDKPASLAAAFSDPALPKFTLDSTYINSATTVTNQSIAGSMTATPKKRKKKKKCGVKKSELVEFYFLFFIYFLRFFSLSLCYYFILCKTLINRVCLWGCQDSWGCVEIMIPDTATTYIT
jgi:hypothetical protein